MLLADLGADVVRVDRPGGPALAVVPPEQDLLGRGKRSVALDLKDPDGRTPAASTSSDAPTCSSRASGPASPSASASARTSAWPAAPRLVYGRMTGWGQDGPYAAHGRARHHLRRRHRCPRRAAARPAGPPMPPLNLLGDFAGAHLPGRRAAGRAARVADVSGVGQVVDAAMVDSTAHLMTMFHGLLAAGAWQDRPGSQPARRRRAVLRRLPHVRRRLDGGRGPGAARSTTSCSRRLGIAPEAADRTDPSTWPALRRAHRATPSRPGRRDEWTEVFAGSDACVAPVLGARARRTRHPHLVGPRHLRRARRRACSRPGPRFCRTRRPDRPPPAAGQHTDEVLADGSAAGRAADSERGASPSGCG